MLAAEKAQLRSSVAVEQLMLRDKELHYYLNTMSSVSTQVQSTGPCSWSQTEYIDDLSISASASATASAAAAASAATVGRQATVAVRHWWHANACQCPQCPQCTQCTNASMHQCAKATLLAGFAFAQLTGYEYEPPDEGYFTLEQLTALGIAHISEDASARGVAGWSWLTWTKQILQVLVCPSTHAVSSTTRSKQDYS